MNLPSICLTLRGRGTQDDNFVCFTFLGGLCSSFARLDQKVPAADVNVAKWAAALPIADLKLKIGK